MRKTTVADFEEVLEYLQNVIYRARKGDIAELEAVDYRYAQDALAAAEESLREINMYEAAENAVNESRKLVLAGNFDTAEELVLSTVRKVMETSGSNERLRLLYATSFARSDDC
jgi:hypothetical protein